MPDQLISTDPMAGLQQPVSTDPSAAAAPQDGAVSRFVGGVARNLNPMGVVSAVAHPIDTAKSLIDAHAAQLTKAKQAYDAGRYSEAVGHLGAAALPVVGPAAADAGEKIGAGDVAGGVGEATGLVGSVLAPGAVAKGVKAGAPALARAVESPAVRAAAAKVVKHGSTAAGAALGGPTGAIVGSAIGDELAGAMRPAAKVTTATGKLAGKAPTLNDALAAALEDVRAEKAPASVELATPGQHPQAAVDTMRMLAEREAARKNTPPAVQRAQAVREVRAVARDAKLQPSDAELKAAVEQVTQGVEPADVVEALQRVRSLMASPSFAGLPSDADVAATVAARNSTGQWQAPRADLGALREATSERRYAELLKKHGGRGQ